MLSGLACMAAETAATGIDSVTNALTTSFTTMGNSIMGVISSVLPIALPVVGAVLVVNVGIKIFKGLVKK